MAWNQRDFGARFVIEMDLFFAGVFAPGAFDDLAVLEDIDWVRANSSDGFMNAVCRESFVDDHGDYD